MDSKCDQTRSEFADSLTFPEEKVIRATFGEGLDEMNRTFASQAIRALIFAHRRREGDADKVAKATAQDMPRGEMLAYFSTDDEATPEEPETVGGKDDETSG